MHWGLVRTIIILPGTVVVFIPAVILAVAKDSQFSPDIAAPGQMVFWLALLAASVGLGLGVWTVTLFMKFGKGTPAPFRLWTLPGSKPFMPSPAISTRSCRRPKSPSEASQRGWLKATRERGQDRDSIRIPQGPTTPPLPDVTPNSLPC